MTDQPAEQSHDVDTFSQPAVGTAGHQWTSDTNPPLVERAHPLTPFIRGWLILVAVFWAFGRDFLPGGERQGQLPPLTWAVSILGAIIAVAVVTGFLEWRFTRFVVSDDELRIESGAISRTSQRIRFDRIQSIDITQPFAARLFGLAELTIDVGGEGPSRLRYLTRQRAGALRDYLLQRAHGATATAPTPDAAGPAASWVDDLAASDEVLIRVPPERLVLGAILSHEFLFLLAPFLLIYGVAALVSPEFANSVRTNPLVLLAPAFPVLGTLGSFVSRRVIGQWNYTMARRDQGVKITRGLTTLTSQSVPRHRIQAVRIAQPIGWRPLDFYRVDIAVLGMHGVTGDEDQAGTSSILMPIGTRAETELALATIWPGLRMDDVIDTRLPARARWFKWFNWRWLGFGLGPSVMVVRSGLLTRVRTIVPYARLQSWQITQGPLQRRLDLADVFPHISSASWLAAVEELDAQDARRLAEELARRCAQARADDVLGDGASAGGAAG